MEDHNLLISPFFASDGTKNIDILSRGSEESLRGLAQQFKQTGGKSLIANKWVYRSHIVKLS